MDSPDWRLTQKWISVEVPWKAEFEQKFRIVLRKESPVVLVLSQLDDRYFDGLQGQYSFRLRFRLHELDSPGEEDYIVRSHGNYLMERSVVTELKSLKAGRYSVFIMVIADRDATARSVEDVVKAECRGRAGNDKLAQVGIAYDLAHGKGAVYTESQAAARKAKAKAKAREERIATRRKNWEKRHLGHRVLRKQDEKNRVKQGRKEAQDEAKENEEEKRGPKDNSCQTEDVKEVPFKNEDKGVQTGKTQALVPETQFLNENDKAVQVQIEDFSGSTASSQGTPSTSKSSRVSSPPPIQIISGPPMRIGQPCVPAPMTNLPNQRKNPSNSQPRYSQQPSRHVRQYVVYDGYSSASPISDFDDLYCSDDDQASKPRETTTGESSKQKKGSDDEDDSEPWNAVCIVGFRVYSQDEGLEVTVYEEDIDEVVKQSDDMSKDAGTEADFEDGGSKKEKVRAVPGMRNIAKSTGIGGFRPAEDKRLLCR